MDFFSKLSDSVVNVAQDMSGKAKEMTDTAKLQMELRSKEDFIKNQYQEIGKKYYEENASVVPAGYEEFFQEILEASSRIAEIKDSIAAAKGGVACPKCGSFVAKGAAFCSNCGNKMEEEIFEEEDDVFAEETSEETVEKVSGEVE